MLSFYLALIDDPADHELFIDFYEHYEKQMLYVAKEALKDEHLAEDAVQDCLTRIARNIKTLRSFNNTQKRNYALTATKNSALDIIKKRNKLETVPLEVFFGLKDEESSAEIENKENVNYAVSVLKQLPPKYRDALYLRYVMEIPEKETADILNIKVNTVRQHVHRGKKMFAELYNRATDKTPSPKEYENNEA